VGRINLITVTIAALAVVLISSAGAPGARAGKVCGRLDLSSPCVSNSDMKPSIVLGGSSGDGRLRIRDDAKVTGVDLRDNGNVTNLFDNDQSRSNGLIKAWAKINEDGTIAACWRCNKDPNETRRQSEGDYEVDFTPLGDDINGRPRSASVSGDGMVPQALIRAIDRTTPPDFSTIHIFTHDPATGALADAPFVLIIY
jgi:hypothetical protein